jgi:hypothetical protein
MWAEGANGGREGFNAGLLLVGVPEEWWLESYPIRGAVLPLRVIVTPSHKIRPIPRRSPE